MRKIVWILLPLLFVGCTASHREKYPYQNPDLPVERRVEDLLSRMSVEEKVAQVSAQLLFMDEFYEKRDVAERINEDTQNLM